MAFLRRILRRLFTGCASPLPVMTGREYWLIAGLGNPGRKYAHTRHNIGFMAVEELGAHHGITLNRNMLKNRIGVGRINNVAAILAQPMDYMNRSGPPVFQLARYFNIDNDHIVIIHDDLDIASGSIKIKAKGGHGGHKGVQSIIEALKTDEFTRLRIGIGRPALQGQSAGDNHNRPDAADYVLGKISQKEMPDYEKVLDTARGAVETILENGTAAAMNRYNR